MSKNIRLRLDSLEACSNRSSSIWAVLGRTGDSGINGEQEGVVLLSVSNWLNFF